MKQVISGIISIIKTQIKPVNIFIAPAYKNIMKGSCTIKDEYKYAYGRIYDNIAFYYFFPVYIRTEKCKCRKKNDLHAAIALFSDHQA